MVTRNCLQMKVRHIEVGLSREAPGSRPSPFGLNGTETPFVKMGGGVELWEHETPAAAPRWLFIFLPKLVLRARFIKIHSNSCRREHQGPLWGELQMFKSGERLFDRGSITATFYKEVNISARPRVCRLVTCLDSSWTEPPAKERKPVHYFWCCSLEHAH